MTRSRIACFSSLLLAASSSLAVDNYTSVAVPPLPGGFGTIGLGVNDAGWVVGQADNMSGALVGYVFHDGVTAELPLLAGGSDARASSINSSNVIVGECRDATAVLRPVMWTLVEGAWTITDLGTLNAANTGFGVATRINNAGQIVGYATVVTSYHGFIWNDGVKTDVGTLSYSGPLAYSQALGLNENGDVAGYAYRVLGGPEHGLYYTDNRGNDITPAGQFGLAQWHGVTGTGMLGGYVSGPTTAGAFRPATYSAATGIVLAPLLEGLPDGYGYDMNEAGVLVGTMFLAEPNPEDSIFLAFKYENGVTTDLNIAATELPGVLTEARDISTTGYIVGTAETEFGARAVLLVPGAPVCPADFNDDGQINPDDLADFITCFFLDVQFPGFCVDADFNGDGSRDPDDLADFITAFFVTVQFGC